MLRRFFNLFSAPKNQVVPLNSQPLAKKPARENSEAQLRKNDSFIEYSDAPINDSHLPRAESIPVSEKSELRHQAIPSQPGGGEQIYMPLDIDQELESIWEEGRLEGKDNSVEEQQLISKIVAWMTKTIQEDKNKQRLGQNRPPQEYPVTCFDLPYICNISLQKYLERLNQYICQGPSDLIMAFSYLNKFRELHPTTPLTEHNAHTLLFLSVVLANLEYSDSFYAGKYLAQVGGIATSYELGLISELNQSGLERNKIYLDFDGDSLIYELSTNKYAQEFSKADLNKIIGEANTNFIYTTLKKSPLDSTMLAEFGYTLALTGSKDTLEQGHFYIKPSTSTSLDYAVINPAGKVKRGTISTQDLPELAGKIQAHLDLESLKPLFPEMLKISAKKGHTLSLRDEILKATSSRGETHTFAKLKNDFVREMAFDFYIPPEAFINAKARLLAVAEPGIKKKAEYSLNNQRTQFPMIKTEEPPAHQKNGKKQLKKY